MNVAYIRVSTIEQNTTRQYEDLKKFKIDKFFEEKASGKSTNRPILKEMLHQRKTKILDFSMEKLKEKERSRKLYYKGLSR